MTTFVYHYIDSSGRGRVHWQQAESAADCCTLLAECGIYPIPVVWAAAAGCFFYARVEQTSAGGFSAPVGDGAIQRCAAVRSAGAHASWTNERATACIRFQD